MKGPGTAWPVGYLTPVCALPAWDAHYTAAPGA